MSNKRQLPFVDAVEKGSFSQFSAGPIRLFFLALQLIRMICNTKSRKKLADFLSDFFMTQHSQPYVATGNTRV